MVDGGMLWEGTYKNVRPRDGNAKCNGRYIFYDFYSYLQSLFNSNTQKLCALVSPRDIPADSQISVFGLQRLRYN